MKSSIKKTLKLGFVMGGGASLGTFSGTALTEAIKQHLVYGQYPTAERNDKGDIIYRPYDKIEIDVFSGASAGAIALGIMLRILSRPYGKFRQLGYASKKEMLQVIEEKIVKQFPYKALYLKNEFPQTFEALIAIQIVQDIQELIWVHHVNSDRFLGTGPHESDMAHVHAFVDRDVVDQLARDFFQFEADSSSVQKPILLAPRVLFACSLANLSYTVKKQYTEQENLIGQANSPLLKALNDSFVKKEHKEMRVFDLHYSPISEEQKEWLPLNWVQYHYGATQKTIQKDHLGQSYNKTIRSLKEEDSWKEIAATALASGAFPFAFEPVVLNRYKYEFGEDWIKELQNKDQHTFTYIDGGIFNNEPVQEALQLASYMDSQYQSTENFDRRIIFVDPNVLEIENKFTVNIHDEYSSSRSVFSGKMSTVPRSPVMRMLSTVPHILQALLHESQGIHQDKRQEILRAFEHRDQLRSICIQSMQIPPNNTAFKNLISKTQESLERLRIQLHLPKNIMQLQHELLRVLREEAPYFNEFLPLDDKRSLVDQMNAFIYHPTPKEHPQALQWFLAIHFVSLDIALQLIQKNSKAVLIPIAPFNFYEEGSNYKLMPLPGGGISGFVGFASLEAGIYEAKYAKYCSKRILEELNLIEPNNQVLELPPLFDMSIYQEALSKKLSSSIVKRIGEIFPQGWSRILPFLNSYLGDQVEKFIHNNLEIQGRQKSIEFRIKIDNELYYINAYNERKESNSKYFVYPYLIDQEQYLIFKLNYDYSKQQWIGPQYFDKGLVCIQKEKLFEDQHIAYIELPTIEKYTDVLHATQVTFTLNASPYIDMYQDKIPATAWSFKEDIKIMDQHLW